MSCASAQAPVVLPGLRGVCRPQADEPSLRVVAFGALVSEEEEVPFLKDNVGSRNSRKIITAQTAVAYGYKRLWIHKMSKTGTDFLLLWKA
jgi:hypothetical protein